MDLGVFIPIGNNGWLISTTSPQYKPTFELNKEIVQARRALWLRVCTLDDQTARLRRKKSEFWDYNLESFHADGGSCRRHLQDQAVLPRPPF